MKKITIEMPIVSQCLASACAYNINMSCHARAITVGDSVHPGCDTFFAKPDHTRASSRTAGVGACKMVNCSFNDDMECITESIRVEPSGDEVRCVTYARR